MNSLQTNPYMEPRTQRHLSTIFGPLSRVSPADGLMISLADAKMHERIDTDRTDEDTLISRQLRTAVRFCEHEISGHRQFLTATYDVPLACWWAGALGGSLWGSDHAFTSGIHQQFGDGTLRVLRPPLQSITSITYRDTNDALTTLDSSQYIVRTPWRAPGEIDLAPNCLFPSTTYQRRYPITVRFVAGYATAITSADATANTLTVTGRTYAAADVVQLTNYGGALPAPLAVATNYYVVNPTNSGATVQLSATSGGSAIDLTDTGSGLSFFGEVPLTIVQAVLITFGWMYQQREPSAYEMSAVESLLNSEGYGSYA